MYAHTVNDYGTLAELRALGVGGIYTDWLAPGNPPRDVRGNPGTTWTVHASGSVPLDRTTLPFFPPQVAGFHPTLALHNTTNAEAVVRITGGPLLAHPLRWDAGATWRR